MDTSRDTGRSEAEGSPLGLKLGTELIFLGLLALYAWVLSPMGPGPWREKVQLVFAIIALYGFGLRFLLQSEALKRFGGLADEMTSANLFKFLRANFLFAAMVASIMSVAMGPEKARDGDGPLVWLLGREVLELPLLLLFAVLMFAYLVFHLVVIMPITYVAYVVVSVPIRRILNSSTDAGLKVVKEEGEEMVTVKGVFSEDAGGMKSLAVAVPAVVMAATLQIVAVLG